MKCFVALEIGVRILYFVLHNVTVRFVQRHFTVNFVKVVLCVKNRSDMGQAENDKEIVAINQMRVKVSWINILTVE